jgi:hypothetical protein
MSVSATDTTPGGWASSIGRYFSVVSFIPSFLLVVWSALLVGSGAWTGPPNWAKAVQVFTEPSLLGAVFVVVLSFVLGAALHPLQFALVQLLEGYWGTSQLGMSMRTARTLRHFETRRYLLRLEHTALERMDELPPGPASHPPPFELLTESNEGQRRTAHYPPNNDELMPTRLGNVLRSYEVQAGSQYGLPLLDFAGHLAHVAPPEQMEYVNDQRTALDFAVRFCFVGLLGSVLSVLFLWQHGIWLLLALLPYLMGYLGYRGAIVVAHHYGQALSALVDLNRFALYERLHVAVPRDTVAERELAEKLFRLVRYSPVESVGYIERPPDKNQ